METFSNNTPISLETRSTVSHEHCLSGHQFGESSTFEFVDIKPDPNFRVIKKDEEGRGTRCSRLSECIHNDSKMFKPGDEIHMASDTDDTFRPRLGHGLLGTILTAYSHHIPLVLRPDDIWIAIITAFSKYVATNSEAMRDCFVSHQGRKELSVAVNSPMFKMTTEGNWMNFVNEMVKEIDKHVTGDVIDWIVPNFTTTTAKDKVVAQVVLMGAMKEYFSYKFTLCCGLSKVTLEGSQHDWELLVERAKYLRTFNQKHLDSWVDLLIPVLEEFVKSYSGTVNSDFWQRICTYKTRGSGSQKTFRGWFLVFSPFSNDGKYLLRPKDQVDIDHIYGNVDDTDIPSCYVNVPVSIIDKMDDDKRYETTFFAGMIMTKYNKEINSLASCVDWAIVINREVTPDDMKGHLEETLKTYIPCKPDKLAKMHELIPFAHYISKEFNFPQDSLLELTEKIIDYVYDLRSTFDRSDLFEDFLIKLSESNFEGRCFNKYIVMSEITSVVNSYKI